MPRRFLVPGSLLLALLLFTTSGLSGRANTKSKSTSKQPKDFSHYVEIAGASKVGTEQCAQCHAQTSKLYRRSPHFVREVECEQCHGPGSLHVEAGGYSKESRDKIVSFRDRKPEEANGACLSCHSKSEHVKNWFSGAHAAQDLKCIDCHTIHGEKSADLESLAQQNTRCLQCHKKQEAESTLPYHHPIREAKMSCNDCHDPHGGSAGNNLTATNANQLCFRCHAEFKGPFSYQHPPVNEDCQKCHAVHGSPNQNMLAISQPALCLQCHSAHHNGASTPLVDRCTNCHNQIHGSDTPSATGGSVLMDK
ncbi:MAG TPA: DmsE family decaheme c-type cytochrome [Candidatus Sulfotelmatobacter sp.]|nr:DmsE family decaheme c-type cytochrome [Candidatus Sulfotelmatobacter sp.]